MATSLTSMLYVRRVDLSIANDWRTTAGTTDTHKKKKKNTTTSVLCVVFVVPRKPLLSSPAWRTTHTTGHYNNGFGRYKRDFVPLDAILFKHDGGGRIHNATTTLLYYYYDDIQSGTAVVSITLRFDDFSHIDYFPVIHFSHRLFPCYFST